jgi:hypothetical protein
MVSARRVFDMCKFWFKDNSIRFEAKNSDRECLFHKVYMNEGYVGEVADSAMASFPFKFTPEVEV